MSQAEQMLLSLDELSRRVNAAEPTAILLAPRQLRRVIKQDRQVSGLGLQVPHRRSYVIDPDALLHIIPSAELGLAAGVRLPGPAILLAAPSNRTLSASPPEGVLLKYWRTLFHARIHVAFEHAFKHRQLSPTDVGERIGRLGAAEFEEIQSVLDQDEYLLPPADEAEVYTEFAALFLELRYFDPSLLPLYFPGLECLDEVNDLLATDIDPERIFQDTRLDGAPRPVAAPAQLGAEREPALLVPTRSSAKPAAFEQFREDVRRAKRAAKRGNTVRAAIWRTRADEAAPPDRLDQAHAEAGRELDRLIGRLQLALGLSETEAKRWRQALLSLLGPAARGGWPVEARLLYDLQKCCINHERPLFAVDLVEWVMARGKQPLRRPLPHQQAVLALRDLRSARDRVEATRLSAREREALAALFHDAIDRQEEQLRARFRPLLHDTLEEVGLRPRHLPERVALNKLVEELLDRILARGFLSLGDLRDALSRNHLKFPDLGGTGEFLHGDCLLRADGQLARMLDGVYRRGEFYLRGLQRFSALAFGTRPGRFLTRYLVLPFGGAYVALEGTQHLVNLVARPLLGIRLHLATLTSVAVLGLFLLGVLYHPMFRQAAARIVWLVYRMLRGILVDLPLLVFRIPLVQRILRSRPARLIGRWLVKPALFAGTTDLMLRADGIDAVSSRLLGAVVFVIASLFLNTRLGRDLEEAVTDALIRAWQRVHFELLPGLFHWVTGIFRRLLETFDRLLYRVDEWLRFRSGDSRLALVGKPLLGVVWFYVSYVARFGLNLLIEPQINPIKHFPVVTVSHKLVTPVFVPACTHLLAAHVDVALAGTIAVGVGALIPGIFGFLVWEFKENWRLYRANQPPTLRPEVIGSHGETMLRLLKPGFHSGTLPKVYAKLRHAERAAHRGDRGRSAHKQREALHHAEEGLRHFIDREFVCLLNQSQPWQPARLVLRSVHTSTNRVRVILGCPDLGPGVVEVAFAYRGGRLLATRTDQDLFARLRAKQTNAFRTALVGLYKLAGVEVVTRPGVAHWNGAVDPTTASSPDRRPFADVAVTWENWIRTWEPNPDAPNGCVIPALTTASAVPAPP